jgi:hypothetical protein
MANVRVFELDELLNRPGTYFNPQTEVLMVVDDSAAVEAEVFDTDEIADADWVLISDDTPIDEHRRDELLETFQARHHPGAIVVEEDDVEDEVDELEPDPDLDELD